jgi:hypothetical protein
LIRFKHSGSFDNTEKFLKRKIDYRNILARYGNEGVVALRSNTPQDSGLTADSWNYEVLVRRNGYSITWTNSNLVDGIPVAILIQYGHGTRNGTFVQGRDFINPAMRPIFDRIAENLWKEVSGR